MWKIKVNGKTKLNEDYKFIEKKEKFDEVYQSRNPSMMNGHFVINF
jgi:hypothetical protein